MTAISDDRSRAKAQRAGRATNKRRLRIAIVIPTLNEAASLRRTVGHIRAALEAADDQLVSAAGASSRQTIHDQKKWTRDASLIVVADCGSVDATVDRARALGCQVVTGPHLVSRATAMNAGAEAVGDSADVLWFIHADTLVPPDAVTEIRRILSDPRVVGGTFDFAWHPHIARIGQRLILEIMRRGNMIRYRLTRNFYGDQTIFVCRDAFQRAGAYAADRLLLEDIYLCKALHRLGPMKIARGVVRTSPRRFLRNGVLRQLLFDFIILLCDFMGMEPRALHQRYQDTPGRDAGADAQATSPSTSANLLASPGEATSIVPAQSSSST